MISELPVPPVPSWLSVVATPLGDLPIHDMLSGSVYYPSCEFDGQPIKFLAGNFYSFVYVDYGVERDKMVGQLDSFRGYNLLAYRNLTPQELTPHGWTPVQPTPADGNPQSHMSWLKAPFGVWAILQRNKEYGPEHGPERFSLIYLGGDGVASFQALYHGNQVAPAVVAIIQPGHSFGCNWTNFTDENLIFARSVLENPAGAPDYLIYGGWGDGHYYSEPCWPRYYQNVRRLSGRLGLWQRPA
ncbi:hypothetical protein [uncultured Thiodictyon sp.]|uniref:hypothetical protein n=1 Tax=uncultured Thiodictyon sp. TaxID=1846217 RepID=UPI0025D80106|nr:hypothetical protein [uncultured Thiodictyon sp.]